MSNIHSLEPLLMIGSSLESFISTPFWESMAWKRGVTGQELFEDANIKIVEENFKKFCNKITGSPPDSKRPINFSIPNRIHFIWLGTPIPPRVNAVIGSWKRCHPEWEIMVWTDLEIANFPWSNLRLQSAFMRAETLAEKADILRLEILYKFGGIYSDTDVICLKSFHGLVTNGLTFFAGLELNFVSPNHKNPLYIGTAIMGAIKGSPIIKYCLDHYRTHEEAPTLNLIIRAGPELMSRACQEALKSLDKESILVLPCSYLFPLPYKYKWIPMKEVLNFISSESLCIHLWDKSWLK